MKDFKKIEKEVLEKKKRKLFLLQSKRILLCSLLSSLSFSMYYVPEVQESEKVEKIGNNSYDILESLTFLFSFGFLNASSFLISRPYYLEEKEKIEEEYEKQLQNGLTKLLKE